MRLIQVYAGDQSAKTRVPLDCRRRHGLCEPLFAIKLRDTREMRASIFLIIPLTIALCAAGQSAAAALKKLGRTCLKEPPGAIELNRCELSFDTGNSS
jgi:hypothetical protein